MSASIAYMAEPPNGLVRNTTNPPNLHRELIAIGVSTTVLALVAVVLRIFTRYRVTRNGIHLDDYMVLCAMGFSMILLGCTVPHMRSGLGYHMWDVKASTFMSVFQIWTLVGTILYATSLAFVKLSILVFYLRLSPHTRFRVLVYILAAIVVIYATVYDLISVFGCRPMAASWNLRLISTATCMDQLTKYMALSVLNIIIDVLTLVLPIPIIARLQMPRRQKISVCAIFATGSFVCAVAIRRTTLLKTLMTSNDYTWAALEQFEWCFAEVNVAIICACAPALKPFFARYLPGLLSSHFGSYNRGDRPSKNTASDVLATPVSKEYSRYGSGNDVYEMQWPDDVSEERPTTKCGGNDDEARLWRDSTGDGPVDRRSTLANRATTVDKRSFEALVPSVASSPAPSPGGTLRCSAPNRINATLETRNTTASHEINGMIVDTKLSVH